MGGIYIRKIVKGIVVGTLSLGLLLTATGTTFAYDYDYEKSENAGIKKRDAIQAKTKKMTAKQKTSYYNNFINTLVKKAKKEKIDVNRVRILYDGIASQITLDKDTQSKKKINKESHTAKGAIVNGTAVTKGYTLALADALTKAGYANTIASVPKKDLYWNKVKIDKSWYNLDVGNGDSDDDNYPFYSYFLRADYAFTEWRVPEYKSPAKYKATNRKYEDLIFIGGSLLFRDNTGFYYMYDDEGIYRYDYNLKKKTYQKFKYPTFKLMETNSHVAYAEVLGKIPEGHNSNKVLKNIVITPYKNLSKRTVLMQSKNAVDVYLLKDKIKVLETVYNNDDEVIDTISTYFNY